MDYAKITKPEDLEGSGLTRIEFVYRHKSGFTILEAYSRNKECKTIPIKTNDIKHINNILKLKYGVDFTNKWVAMKNPWHK